jgi:hypothetical protein
MQKRLILKIESREKKKGEGRLPQQPCLRRSIYGHHSGAAVSSLIGEGDGSAAFEGESLDMGLYPSCQKKSGEWP